MRGCALNRCFEATPTQALLAAVAICLSIALFQHEANAQLGCPGQWVPGGGGMMCRCPDGSYANLVGDQIVCNGGSNYRSNGNVCPNGGTCPSDQTCCGNLCCNQGHYCSKYGCTPNGAVECGSWYCNPGSKCSQMHNKCVPGGKVDCGEYFCEPGQRCASSHRACLDFGDVDCGAHSCRSGYYCGSSNSCLADGSADCGNGTSCPTGRKCSRDAKRCLSTDAVDCGSYSCNAGSKCGSGNSCLHRDWVDCGGGKSCAPGQVCVNGGSECLTSAQIADRKAAEEKKAKAPDAAGLPNIEDRPVRRNYHRVIETLREIGAWITAGAAKPFPSVPVDVLVFCGGVILGVALLLNYAIYQFVQRQWRRLERLAARREPERSGIDRQTSGEAPAPTSRDDNPWAAHHAVRVKESPWAVGTTDAGANEGDEVATAGDAEKEGAQRLATTPHPTALGAEDAAGKDRSSDTHETSAMPVAPSFRASPGPSDTSAADSSPILSAESRASLGALLQKLRAGLDFVRTQLRSDATKKTLRDAAPLVVVGALCIVGIAFFFGSPSEADAKQAVDSLLRCLLNDVSFRFIEFRKTGGNERSELGMHWYEVRYHAVVELPSGIVGKKKSDNEQFLANMNSMTQQLSFAEHGFRIIKGDIVHEYMLLQADFVVNFKKVDGRWVAERGC